MENYYYIDGDSVQHDTIEDLVEYALIGGICPSSLIYDSNDNCQGSIIEYMVE